MGGLEGAEEGNHVLEVEGLIVPEAHVAAIGANGGVALGMRVAIFFMSSGSLKEASFHSEVFQTICAWAVWFRPENVPSAAKQAAAFDAKLRRAESAGRRNLIRGAMIYALNGWG
jgi:hypothetical protein